MSNVIGRSVDQATESLHSALDAAGFGAAAHRRAAQYGGPSRVDMNAHSLVEALLLAGWTPPQSER